jgi:hypothetical protein
LVKIKRYFTATAFQLHFKIRIRKIQENALGLEVNDAHQHLAHAEDMNLLSKHINNKENTKVA